MLSDSELPLVLPVIDDYQGHNGKAPLENAIDWKNVCYDGVKELGKLLRCLVRLDLLGIF